MWIRNLGPRITALSALAALLVVDAGLVLLHVLHRSGDVRLRDRRYSLETDRGLSELFGYGKEGALVIALLFLYRRLRALEYAAWSFAFLIFLADDSFKLHERGGYHLASRLDLPSVSGLRAQDAGELIVWAVLGALVLAALVVGHLHSTAEARAHCRRLVPFLAALVFFAVILDMADILVAGTPQVVVAVIEDGGEQIVLSGTIAYVIWMAGDAVSRGLWRAARPRDQSV